MDFIVTCSCVSLYFAHTYDLSCPPNPSPPSIPLPISLRLPAKEFALCVHIYSYIWVLHMKENMQYIVFLPITVSFSYLLLEVFLSHCLPSIPCHIHKCMRVHNHIHTYI